MILTAKQRQHFFKQKLQELHCGNERGLSFFYTKYYRMLYSWVFRATKNDSCAAMSIVQEAFLKLWQCRKQMEAEAEIVIFLKAQVHAALLAYYRQSYTRFHRHLLLIDGIEDHQDFLLAEPQDTAEDDSTYLDGLEQQRSAQLAQLKQLLPTLKSEQKLFIRLCLKYSFNYDRIAYYLGGISDYEVGMKVEKTLAELRQIFTSNDKLTFLNQPETKLCFEGDFTAQQEEVFRMRYTLRYSFSQIAESLKLSDEAVKKLFVNAHANINKNK